MGNNQRSELRIVLGILTIATVITLYWFGRYANFMDEHDGAKMARYTEAIYTLGTINVDEADAYPSGFGYPAVHAMISHITGLSPKVVSDLTAWWFVPLMLIAYVLYRRLLNYDRLTAALGVFLLICIPDVIFYFLRDSHERFTWSYVMLLIFVLAASQFNKNSLLTFSRLVIIFYLLLMGLVFNHVFFATTFMTTVCIALFFWIALRFITRRSIRQRLEYVSGLRLAIISFVTIMMIYTMLEYVYDPAGRYLEELDDIASRIEVLLLGYEDTEAATTTTVVEASRNLSVDGLGLRTLIRQSWSSPYSYAMVTTGQWIILLMAGGAALYITYRTWRGRLHPSIMVLLLLTIFFSISAQTFIALGTDIFRLTRYNNLQLRFFVLLGIASAPLAAMAWLALIRSARSRKVALYRAVLVASFAFASYAVIASSFKTTLDPLVTNNWLFYSPQEKAAVLWMEDGRIRDANIRWGHWVNQRSAVNTWLSYDVWDENNYTSTLNARDTQVVLLSTNTIYNSERTGLPVPEIINEDGILYNRVYATSDVSLYTRVPSTPFQD